MLETTYEIVGDVSVLRLVGELEGTTAPEFERGTLSMIQQYGHRRILLDLSGVQFISSAGLRSILTIMKKLKEVNGSLAVCALLPHIEQVFTTSGFIKLFNAFPSRDAALQSTW